MAVLLIALRLLSSKMDKINKDMTFKDVIEKFPDCAAVMMSHGLHCVGCHAASFESIEQGAKAHGMSEKDVENMVKELNKAAAKK